MISANLYPVLLKNADTHNLSCFFSFSLQIKYSHYPDDENYEFSGYPDGMYDEEDEIGTGYLDDDFEEKTVSKKDRDDRDDLEMVYNTSNYFYCSFTQSLSLSLSNSFYSSPPLSL